MSLKINDQKQTIGTLIENKEEYEYEKAIK